MKILVCVKQIQDPEIAPALFSVDEKSNAVVSVPGVSPVMSPYDEQAIEAALRIKDKNPSAKVVVLTVGPPTARDVLKQALSLGADEAVLLEAPTKVFQDDAYAVATLVKAATRRLGDVDLILTGRQSADMDSGVTGCGLAEWLDIPAISFGKKVEIVDGKLNVERVLDDGTERVEADLPALVTITNELGPPRKPSLRETMRASKKPTQTWTTNDLAGNEFQPKQDLVRLYIPKKEKHCEVISGGSSEEVAGNLVRKLRDLRLI